MLDASPAVAALRRDRGRVDHAGIVHAERVDFAERRLEQDEGLPVAVDAEDAARRLGARQQVAAPCRTPAQTTLVDRVL